MPIQQFSSVAELKTAIQQLEIQQANEWPPLKEQLLSTAETLKPKHIIKNMLGEALSKPAIKTTAVSATLGLATLLAANFFFPTKTSSKLIKLVTSTIVGLSTIRKVVNRGSQIKSIGSRLLKRLSGKKPAL